MPSYKCSKCDETSHSKCPRSRTVFPSDQYATRIHSVMDWKVVPFREGSEQKCLQIEIGCFSASDEKTAGEHLREFLTEVRCNMNDEIIKHLTCNHRWEKTSKEECLNGPDCCK